MAYKENWIGLGDEGSPFILYNVEMAVGEGAPNRRDDVMLVQYMLREVYKKPLPHPPPIVRPTGKDMKVDGIFGPVTAKWIRHYQKENRSIGVPLAADGRVDHAKGLTTPKKLHWTIQYLNLTFQRSRPDIGTKLEDAPDVPPELENAIRRGRVTRNR